MLCFLHVPVVSDLDWWNTYIVKPSKAKATSTWPELLLLLREHMSANAFAVPLSRHARKGQATPAAHSPISSLAKVRLVLVLSVAHQLGIG